MALAIPESKCVIVIWRLGEIQCARSSIFAIIGMKKLEGVVRLINKRRPQLERTFDKREDDPNEP